MQAQSAKPYFTAVRNALNSALCLRNFPSQTVRTLAVELLGRVPSLCLATRDNAPVSLHTTLYVQYSQVERHNRPEVEDRSSKELLLPTVTIPKAEGSREAVLIEPSINSVRVSLRIKQVDELERLLVHKFTAFLQQRAESFIVLRRRPVAGWDLSFLITHAHLEAMVKDRVVDFILKFMEGAWQGRQTAMARQAAFCGSDGIYPSIGLHVIDLLGNFNYPTFRRD